MTIIENMGQYPWWLYPPGDPGQEIAGLWLSTQLGAEELLIGELVSAVGNRDWLLSGTWHSRERASVQGFGRYPALAREILATAESRTPRGLVSSSEWCLANPDPALLNDYASMVRHSRGKGSSITLAPEGSSRRTWYAATAGANWRSTLALDFESSGLEFTDRVILGCYFEQLVRVDLIAVVPFDLHPLSGFALIGAVEQLAPVAASLPGLISSLGADDVAQLFNGGGGLAL